MGKLYNYDARGYEVATRTAGSTGGRSILAAKSGWANAFRDGETTFVKIPGIFSDEVAVDGSTHHAAIINRQFYLVPKVKASNWPLPLEKVCQVLGIPVPSDSKSSSSSVSPYTLTEEKWIEVPPPCANSYRRRDFVMHGSNAGLLGPFQQEFISICRTKDVDAGTRLWDLLERHAALAGREHWKFHTAWDSRDYINTVDWALFGSGHTNARSKVLVVIGDLCGEFKRAEANNWPHLEAVKQLYYYQCFHVFYLLGDTVARAWGLPETAEFKPGVDILSTLEYEWYWQTKKLDWTEWCQQSAVARFINSQNDRHHLLNRDFSGIVLPHNFWGLIKNFALGRSFEFASDESWVLTHFPSLANIPEGEDLVSLVISATNQEDPLAIRFVSGLIRAACFVDSANPLAVLQKRSETLGSRDFWRLLLQRTTGTEEKTRALRSCLITSGIFSAFDIPKIIEDAPHNKAELPSVSPITAWRFEGWDEFVPHWRARIEEGPQASSLPAPCVPRSSTDLKSANEQFELLLRSRIMQRTNDGDLAQLRAIVAESDSQNVARKGESDLSGPSSLPKSIADTFGPLLAAPKRLPWSEAADNLETYFPSYDAKEVWINKGFFPRFVSIIKDSDLDALRNLLNEAREKLDNHQHYYDLLRTALSHAIISKNPVATSRLVLWYVFMEYELQRGVKKDTPDTGGFVLSDSGPFELILSLRHYLPQYVWSFWGLRAGRDMHLFLHPEFELLTPRNTWLLAADQNSIAEELINTLESGSGSTAMEITLAPDYSYVILVNYILNTPEKLKMNKDEPLRGDVDFIMKDHVKNRNKVMSTKQWLAVWEAVFRVHHLQFFYQGMKYALNGTQFSHSFIKADANNKLIQAFGIPCKWFYLKFKQTSYNRPMAFHAHAMDVFSLNWPETDDPEFFKQYALDWTEPVTVIDVPLPDSVPNRAIVLSTYPENWTAERFTVPQDISDDEFVSAMKRRREFCDPMLNCIRQISKCCTPTGPCSVVIAGPTKVYQHLWRCGTCNMHICAACKAACHGTHDVEEKGVVLAEGLCSCGSQGLGSCQKLDLSMMPDDEILAPLDADILLKDAPITHEVRYTHTPRTKVPVPLQSAPTQPQQSAATSAQPQPLQPQLQPHPQPQTQPFPQHQVAQKSTSYAPVDGAVKGKRRFKLKLEVKSAKLLTPADANGLADPYFKIKQNGKKLYKSGVKYKTLSPSWNDAVDLELEGIDGNVSFVIEVWDRDHLMHDFMCRTTVGIRIDSKGIAPDSFLRPGVQTQVALRNKADKDDGYIIVLIK